MEKITKIMEMLSKKAGNLHKNLLFMRKTNEFTQAEQAEIYGVKRTAYANYESGLSNPDYVTLLFIAGYNHIGIESLFDENLPSYYKKIEKYDSSKAISDFYIKPNGKVSNVKVNSNNNIPLMPTKALASFNNEPVQIAEYEVEHYFSLPILKDKADFAWQIDGDSMAPTYENKAFLACKNILIEDLKWEQAYLITVNHAPMVKRLIPSVNTGNIVCRSDNERHRDFEVQKEDITSIAKILAYINIH